MKRHGRSLLSFLILGLVAMGHAEPVTTELVFWGTNLGPDTKGTEARIHEFERRNPGIRVRTTMMGAGEMNPQKLMTAIVGNVPPDVIKQDRFTVSDWASRGAFMPLDELIERDKAEPSAPSADKFYPATWKEAQFEGKQYAIPTEADDRVLYYNKKIFADNADKLRAAGLDPDRPPRTWSEVLAYSKVLTVRNPDGTLKRAGFIPNYGNSWLYIYSFQNNGYFMSPDGRTCTMANQNVVEAIEFMKEGYKILGGYDEAQKFQSSQKGGENDAFIVGNIAMKIDGDWIIVDLARYGPQLEFGVAPPPVPDDRYYRRGKFADEKDQFITWIGGFSMAIPRGARHPEEAWKFIKWMTSTEAMLIEIEAQKKWEQRRGREYIPRNVARIDLNEKQYELYRSPDKRYADAQLMHKDMMPFARYRPATFVGQRLWDEQIRAMENACRGKMTPMEALLTSQGVVQRELDAVYGRTKYPVVDLRLPAIIGACAGVVGIVILAAAYRRQPLGAMGKKEALWGYIFLSPWILGFLVFTLGPMIASFFFSFTEYNVLQDARWVGANNYVELMQDRQHLLSKAFMNVLYLGGIGVPLGLFTGLAIALLLNTSVRGVRFYRTAFYLPSIVPAVASIVLWLFILNPDVNRGLLSGAWQVTIQRWFGVPPAGWMQVEYWTKPSIILMGLWGAGGGMILWLAGLKGIPNTLYEAASLDGANGWKQFWSITLPQLSPVVFFNAVTGLIGAVQTFDQVYIATGGVNGGASDSLLTPVYLLFRNGFTYFKMGYASALAWVIFLLILVLTLFQLGLAKHWVHYEVDK